MRQQSRLGEHRVRRLSQIRQRGLVAEALECLARGGVSQLGSVSERKQQFLALRSLPRSSNLEHCVDRQVRRFALSGRLREGAVVADIATELRERYEDF